MSAIALQELANADVVRTLIGDQDRIAVDTEFLRERTYFAQLCLLQVATRDSICCFDPLTGSLPPEDSWRLLLATPWVLHSGRQDIEVIYQAANAMPVNVFDTQVAAGLLGFQPQVGYAGLVKELFDVSLDKTHTRADWSRRPLNDQMLAYAAEDVEYLLPAYDLLVDRLQKEGRLSWALEDSADLLDPELYSVEPSSAVGRLKGARNLRGESRRVAVQLAQWREAEAIRSNRPRQWILKDRILLDIAERRPTRRSQLADIEGFPERTLRRAGDHLIDGIRNAVESKDDYRPPQRPDEAQKALLKAMQSKVSEVAETLTLPAEIIAPKKELSAAVSGDLGGRVFRGWRGELVGEKLAAMI